MGLLNEMDQIRRDIAYARAFRNFKILTTTGDIPLRYSPVAQNAIIDLRSLSASGTPPPSDIPDPTGHAGEFLLTDGAVPYWGLDPEVITWRARAIAAGGTLTAQSIAIASAISAAVRRASFNSKIVASWPVLGGNLATARVPLRDTLGVGIAGNQNFVDADFSEAHGLQGNGTSKILDSLIKPSQLNADGHSGGIFWWENNINFSGTSGAPIGMIHNPGGGTRAHDLELGASTYTFQWNQDLTGRAANSGVAATNGFYGGQRISATSRKLYRNGVLVATSTTSDPADDTTSGNLRLVGADTSNVAGGLVYWAGRCAAAVFTDGTLTDAEVTALYTLFNTYLITPLGR